MDLFADLSGKGCPRYRRFVVRRSDVAEPICEAHDDGSHRVAVLPVVGHSASVVAVLLAFSWLPNFCFAVQAVHVRVFSHICP